MAGISKFEKKFGKMKMTLEGVNAIAETITLEQFPGTPSKKAAKAVSKLEKALSKANATAQDLVVMLTPKAGDEPKAFKEPKPAKKTKKVKKTKK